MGGEFHYASDLVAFIRKETGDDFHIEVAAYPEVHPQAKSPESDLQAYVSKVKAGANSAITQYFYNTDAYFRFVDDAYKLGVDVPVVPGIMPITSSARFVCVCRLMVMTPLPLKRLAWMWWPICATNYAMAECLHCTFTR
jgi:methylenetetrahydrofolate reductase (NADPH)